MVVYLLIICAAFYVATAALVKLVGDYLFDQKVAGEQRVAASLAQSSAGALASRDAEVLFAALNAPDLEAGARVMALDLYGVAQADTQSALNGQQIRLHEVAEVLSGAPSSFGYYPDRLPVDGMRAPVAVYAQAIEPDGERLGVLMLIMPAEAMRDSLRTVQMQMLGLLILIAAAVLALSLSVSRMITRPIAALNQGIEHMARGDFTTRVRVRGRSEFAQLAKAFNMMCDRLENLDRARNQFVSNASHELKTPLSTMKILIETLLYQEGFDPAVQKEFLTDVNREIDRLSTIIGDLLALVHIDSQQGDMTIEPIALGDLAGDILNRLTPLARERGIELSLSARDQVLVTGDKSKLIQAAYNLVDNAIKYTPRGGRVKVEISKSGKRATLKVMDTGIGISKADQAHVFDRFYRVDKARSRDTGGTGLGLAIVKQIVTLHGGDVSVLSEEGKGSTFTVELPLGAG